MADRIKQGRWVTKHNGRWELKARVVMEKKLDHPIPAGHDVHHIDEDTLNDDPGNLELKLHGTHKADHNMGNQYNRKMAVGSEIAQVTSMLRELGWTYRRISLALGLSYQCVFYNKDVFERRKPPSDGDVITLVKLLVNGGSKQDAEKFQQALMPTVAKVLAKRRR